ncbi:MAG: type II/IV secretion system protein [Phycisphaera sp.]|nr:MAG: type II/IV secretion system protein [Phycisphaera sp.]
MGIGTVLLERDLITRDQLDEAIVEQARSGERLDRVLLRMGIVDRGQVLQAVGEQLRLEVVDLTDLIVDKTVLESLPAKIVFRHHCVPIDRHEDTLTVATSDPFQLVIHDELGMHSGCAIELVLADDEDLRAFIRTHYGVAGDTLDAMSGDLEEVITQESESDELDQAQEASVIRLVNDILGEAIAVRATDIHIEPYENELIVRYRIDGVLHRANLPATVHRFAPAIVSRLKIMSSLNIAEKRKPQDGRITFKHRVDGKGIQEFDLRVSVIPMVYGEGLVLRVLNKSAVQMTLDQLGMPQAVEEPWESLITRPHGILLVTGPTGSGKSTTLYASLNRIVSESIKAITVEDPVEYQVEGVNQIQVNSKVGLTFATGLRAILRHDPDVVMIGEIRDLETAQTAVQASLTGHLVFSTLHTNDAPGAVTRLLDMGVEPFLVSSSVEGVLAQRLVRKLCPDCKTELQHEDIDLPEGLKVSKDDTLYRPAGCKQCLQRGFLGRVGVYEIMRLSESIREMVMERKSATQIAAAAGKEGNLYTLKQDAFEKVKQGITTVEEAARAIAT